MAPRIADEDYEAMKGFFAVMSEELMRLMPPLPPEDHPMAVLERQEKESMSIARRGLEITIGDMVELFQDLPEDQLGKLDRRLEVAGLPTLSAVRARFSRKIAGIMKRGRLRSEAEYYALRNAVDMMPEAESGRAWELLGAFELAVPRTRARAQEGS
jgi:hypothetical protein